jgi:DNA-binding transcriptional MerR regulator
MADSILDREKHPDWNGERTKMVYSFPTNEKLWAKYAEIRADGLRADKGIAAATEFYRLNREAMDEGAVVAWTVRFNHDELSAIQHAMNLKLQDEAAFQAEYQNEPLPEKGVEDEGLLSPKRKGQQRVYGDRERTRVKLILRGKRLGLALSEIRELFDLYATTRSERPQLVKFLQILADRRAMLHQQREDIDAVLAEIAVIERDCRRRLQPEDRPPARPARPAGGA